MGKQRNGESDDDEDCQVCARLGLGCNAILPSLLVHMYPSPGRATTDWHKIMASQCEHTNLRVESSHHVLETKYQRVDENRRVAAAQLSGRVPKNVEELKVSPYTFPAPLCLPGDELAEDGRYPPQSLRSWHNGAHRNPVTKNRRTIYIAAPPIISADVSDMRSWSNPSPQLITEKSSKGQKDKVASVDHPPIDDIRGFFEAFFLGMEVRLLEAPWRFTGWDSGRKHEPRHQQDAVSLETTESAVRIRTRASLDGCFEAQLNLSDLLDACIEALPQDAYALLLLVEHDMYEDDDDDFCCGRAFGGDGVAVVSTARYNPVLDLFQGVDRIHAWPAAHCEDFMRDACPRPRCRKVLVGARNHMANVEDASAMRAAVQAHSALPVLGQYTDNTEAHRNLWLGRICKTAAHEVGHCLGIDHCTYFACLMQGTANIGEDARQPPFLCPVDLAKYTAATGCDVQGRYEALLAFCLSKPGVHLFAAFAAWIEVRLRELHERESRSSRPEKRIHNVVG